MGILDDLSLMLGTRVTQVVNSQLFDWIRAVTQVVEASTVGLSQAAWFIDPVNGNDENVGNTAANPIKTDAERQRRWGDFTLLTQPTTVTYFSSPPASDVINYNVAYATGGSLTIAGTKTVTNPAQALAAVTTLNRATQTPWDVTGVSLGAADVGRMMRITAGARAGNYAAIAKDLTGNKVRISPFGSLDFTTAVSANPFPQVTPQAGDLVEVFTVPTLTIGTLIFSSHSASIFTSTTNCIIFDTIALDGNFSSQVTMLGSIVMQGGIVFLKQSSIQRCKIAGVGGFYMAGGIISNTCHISAGFSNNQGPLCQFMGCMMPAGRLTSQTGSAVLLGGDILFQTSRIEVFGNCFGEFVSVFDHASADSAVIVLPGGCYRSRGLASTDLLWGDGNAGRAVRIFSGGAMTYVTKPTINTPLGAGRMSLVGGTNKDWATIPYVEAANNAMIVVEA